MKVKLGEIANIQMGQSPSSSTYNNIQDGLPFYQGITEFNEKYVIPKTFTSSPIRIADENDILFSVRAPVGEVNITRERCCIGRGNASMRMKNGNQEYLYYLLKANKKSFLNYATGSVFESISGAELKNFELNIEPDEKEQKRISNILSSFDNKIELLRKENKTLEDIAQSIFKEWFVKYNFPNKDGKPYRDNNGKMIDSELGLIPEGWEVISLTDIADFVNGLPMQKYRPKEGDDFLPVIKIKELNSGYSKDTEKAKTDLDEKYVVNPGDVVFSWSGSIGMDLWKYSKGALNQHLFKVTSKDYPKWFYYYWIKHYLPEFKQIAEGKATTMGHIQRGHLTHCLVPIPQKIENPFILGILIDKGICNNRILLLLEEQKRISLNKLLT